jgi:acyl carrier protein
MTDIEKQIRFFLTEIMLFGDDSLEYSDDDSLIENGIIDSLAVLELVLFAQETFGITVEDQEITPDNFDSVANLSNFVRGKLNHQ